MSLWQRLCDAARILRPLAYITMRLHRGYLAFTAPLNEEVILPPMLAQQPPDDPIAVNEDTAHHESTSSGADLLQNVPEGAIDASEENTDENAVIKGQPDEQLNEHSSRRVDEGENNQPESLEERVLQFIRKHPNTRSYVVKKALSDGSSKMEEEIQDILNRALKETFTVVSTTGNFRGGLKIADDTQGESEDDEDDNKVDEVEGHNSHDDTKKESEETDKSGH